MNKELTPFVIIKTGGAARDARAKPKNAAQRGATHDGRAWRCAGIWISCSPCAKLHAPPRVHVPRVQCVQRRVFAKPDVTGSAVSSCSPCANVQRSPRPQ